MTSNIHQSLNKHNLKHPAAHPPSVSDSGFAESGRRAEENLTAETSNRWTCSAAVKPPLFAIQPQSVLYIAEKTGCHKFRTSS